MPTSREDFEPDYADQAEPATAAQNARFIAVIIAGVVLAVALAMVLSLT